MVFFFGFPMAGLLFVYFRAHATIRASAQPFVAETTQEVLGESDFKNLYFLGTLTLKGSLTKETFSSWLDRYGDYKALHDLHPTRSWVGSRADQSWQYASFAGTVEFSKGDARLDFVAARRSTALSEWRVEKFLLTPATD